MPILADLHLSVTQIQVRSQADLPYGGLEGNTSRVVLPVCCHRNRLTRELAIPCSCENSRFPEGCGCLFQLCIGLGLEVCRGTKTNVLLVVVFFAR